MLRALPVESVLPLRAAVLRPGQGAEAARFAGDDHPDALHVGWLEDGALLGVATVVPEPHPRAPAAGDWRVRGMATDPGARGRGLGFALLEACLRHAAERGGRRAWCHARVAAAPLYRRAGFAVEDGPYELEGIGAHLLMARPLAAGAP